MSGPTRIIGGALLSVILLLGCSGTAGEPLARGTSPEATPIERVLGIGVTQEERDRLHRIEQQGIEEQIERCMKRQGFDYQPVDYSQYTFFGGLTEEEYRDRYGYGISTTFQDAMPFGGGHLVALEPADPNEAIVANMSQEERAAYLEALEGAASDLELELDEPEIKGCRGEAMVDASSTNVDNFYVAFDEEMRRLDERVMSDSRIVIALSDWSACMSTQGYPYGSPEQIYDELVHAMEPYRDGTYWPPDDGDLPEASIELLSPEAREELAEVQRREWELYQVDIACQRGLEEVFRTVRTELEEAFLDENEAQVIRFLGG